MDKINYKEITSYDASSLFRTNCILLVTATDTETDATHKTMTALPGFDSILQVFHGSVTFFIGVLGSYKVVHVQCSMGSISRDSSIMTVSEALKTIRTKVVIMVGIAFGVDKGKQKIGDVLVAEVIQPYNNKRVGQSETIPRAYAVPSSKKLYNRFKNLKAWEYLLTTGNKAEMIPGLVLSGEELIDNKEYRDELVNEFKNAKGGEMEGAGIYSACDSKADCILIKGICDFADGDKGVNKKENQKEAIQSALSLCLELFSSLSAFSDFGILPVEQNLEQKFNASIHFNDSLFDVYDKGKERFYIVRDLDQQITDAINNFNVWAFGPTGCGKSNLILRNLIINDVEFIQVNLASCVGSNVEDFFKEIFCDVKSKIEGAYCKVVSSSFSESSKQLLELLKKHYVNRKVVIFVEEIPISSAQENKDFAEKMFSILIAKTLIPGLNDVKFVLSSINNPSEFIQPYNQKIYQHLKFIELKYWDNPNINLMIDTIEAELNYNLEEKTRSELILSSNGSPRFVKKVYRSVHLVNRNEPETIKQIIQETTREFR